MGFFDNNIGKVDKRGLLSEVLQQNKFADMDASNKASLILSRATRAWDDIGDALYTSEEERINDSNFQLELAKVDNLDLVSKYQISINDVPLLRSTKNKDDFEVTLNEIKERQEEDFKLSGAVKGVGWNAFNFATNVITDPLFLPTLFVPTLGVTRYGRILGALTDATYGASLSYGLNSLEELATKKKKDIGELTQDMIINGFLFGAIGAYNAKTPISRGKVRATQNNLLDWTQRHLIPYKDKNSVILSYATAKPTKWRGAISKHVNDITRAFERFNITESDIASMFKERGVYASVAKEIFAIYKSPKAGEILSNVDHPLMKSIQDKIRATQGKKTAKETKTNMNASEVELQSRDIVTPLQAVDHLPTIAHDVEINNITIDGSINSKASKGVNKALGLAGGGALFFGSSMDLDAEDIINSNNGITDLLLGVGVGILAWKGRKGIKEMGTRTKQQLSRMKDYKGFNKIDFFSREGFGYVGGTKWLNTKIKELDLSNMPTVNHISTKLMDNLASVMNATDEVLEPISSIKNDFMNGIKAKLYVDVGKRFEQYKEEIGFSSLNPIKHIRARENFYEEIGKAYTIQDFSKLTKAQKDAVQHFNTSFREILDGLKDAKVKGFENMKGWKNYFPRYHKSKMYDEVANYSKADRERVMEWYSDSVKRGFIKAYGKEITNEMAKKLAKQLLLYGKSDKIINQAKQDIFEELDLSNMDEYFGRAKFRIPLDFKIKGLEVNGKTLEMVDFMDTNAYSVFSRYAYITSGHYAFGVHGVESIPEMIKTIKNEFVKTGGSKQLQDTLLDYVNYLSGKPIIDDMNRSLVNFSQLLSKATSAQLLHLSGLSTMSEVIPSIVTSIYNGHMGEAWKSFVKAGREPLERLQMDSITDELISVLGYGEKRILSRETFKNSRPYTGEDIGLQGDLATKLDRLLTAQQKVTFFLNQLPALEDFANVLNVKSSFKALYSHLTGKKIFNDRRKETLGLNTKRESILRGMLSKGKLNDSNLNTHTWTQEEIGAFKTVMTQMQRAKVGESVLGDTPRFIMKNPLYKSLITLLSFPIQSFDNMLLRDLYARDAESIMRFKLMLIGNMLGIQLKDTINQNKRAGDKPLMERAIMHMPHMALLDIGASVFGKGRKTTLGHIFPAIGVLENALSVPQSALNLAMGEGKGKDTRVLLQALSVPLALGRVLAEEPPKPKGLGGVYNMSATISEIK